MYPPSSMCGPNMVSRMHDKEKTDLIMKTWHKETMKMRSFPRWFLYLIDVSCTTLGGTFQMGCTQQHRNRILCRGGSSGGVHPAHALPKIRKNMIFWRKIVIFRTKYPKKFHVSLCSAQFFLSAPPPPNLKFWIRPCYVYNTTCSIGLGSIIFTVIIT